MRRHTHTITLVTLFAGVAASGCGSDSKKSAPSGPGNVDASTDGPSGSGGSSGVDSGTGGAQDAGGGSGGTVGDSGGCDVTVSPSDDDVETIQTALIEVTSGGTICLAAGDYTLERNISLTSAQNVTLRGLGVTKEDTHLDFSDQIAGDEGVLVTTDGFTIENLWISNTTGNGIKVQADDSVFRNIKVSWDVVDESNGAYAIYPTGCVNTLMEDCEVSGAADAGIYAGQCENVIVRRNKAYDNVLGIEIENTTNADVYDNEVYNNTTGFLLDLLPNLQKKTSSNYLIHDNHIHDNNLPNFAEPNTLAATAPQGTGVLVLAADDIELTGNTIEDNEGVAVLIVSFDIIDLLSDDPADPDPETNRYPERIYVHGNTYMNNGTNPEGALALLAQGADGGKTIDYHVLWDGILDPETATAAEAQLCLGSPEVDSFLNFQPLFDPTGWSTDTTAHQCTLDPISPLTP